MRSWKVTKDLLQYIQVEIVKCDVLALHGNCLISEYFFNVQIKGNTKVCQDVITGKNLATSHLVCKIKKT